MLDPSRECRCEVTGHPPAPAQACSIFQAHCLLLRALAVRYEQGFHNTVKSASSSALPFESIGCPGMADGKKTLIAVFGVLETHGVEGWPASSGGVGVRNCTSSFKITVSGKLQGEKTFKDKEIARVARYSMCTVRHTHLKLSSFRPTKAPSNSTSFGSCGCQKAF
ncbi:Uncharacterized protein HZ326_29774 [Fusarium oxysporum f. sp. albedinis]|nr:Uncharacterized protein HZ326_29774 [Fusarium oxysporum f. sp. albedinis]